MGLKVILRKLIIKLDDILNCLLRGAKNSPDRVDFRTDVNYFVKKNERASFRHVLEGHASPFSTPFQDVTFIISHDTPWYKQVNFEYIGGSRGGAQGGGRFPVNGTLICTKN